MTSRYHLQSGAVITNKSVKQTLNFFISVISNDMLYGSDVEFCQAINNYATTICEDLLVVLKNLGETKQQYKQCYVTLELLWRVVKRSDIQIPSMASLATKLWMLSQKLPTNNTKLRVSRFNFFLYICLQPNK